MIVMNAGMTTRHKSQNQNDVNQNNNMNNNINNSIPHPMRVGSQSGKM